MSEGGSIPVTAEAAPRPLADVTHRAGVLDPLQTGALLQAVLDIGSDLDLDATLQRIVEAAVSLVGARYGALGVIDERGTGLQRFITVGLDEASQQAIGAGPRGLGLLGELISDARPLRADNLADHPSSAGFPAGHPPMTSFLGVPVLVRNKVFGSLYLTDKIGPLAFTALDEELATGLAMAAGVAIDHARLFGEAERHRLALAAVHEVATAFVTGSDPRETLSIIAGHARQLVGADLATIALPGEGDTMVIEVADGLQAGVVCGQRFAREGSISSDVMRSGETVVVDDASQDRRRAQPQVSAGHLGPSAFVALRVAGRTFGSLAVARDRGGAVFTRAELALIETFAAHAGVIVERDQDRRRNARLNVIEDRERIARNLHDTVIQRLFAAGLSLQAASSRPEEIAKLRMNDVVDELDAVINTIRSVIFDIDVRPPTGIRQQVLDLVQELHAVLGFEPAVIFTGPVDTLVGATLGAELVATLREGLSNVARHAHAGRAEIEVRAQSGQLTLLVRDDGVGKISPLDRGHAALGVRNMTTRALQLGGGFRLDHPPTGGTVMSWQVPCD